MKTTDSSKRATMVDRMLGYTGLILIGTMAWTCDRLGIKAQAPAVRPSMQPLARGTRS